LLYQLIAREVVCLAHARLFQEHRNANGSDERNLEKFCAFVFDKHRVLHCTVHKIRIKKWKKSILCFRTTVQVY